MQEDRSEGSHRVNSWKLLFWPDHAVSVVYRAYTIPLRSTLVCIAVPLLICVSFGYTSVSGKYQVGLNKTNCLVILVDL